MKRVGRYLLDFLVPFVVVLVLVWCVHLSLQQSEDAAAAARVAKAQACSAVAAGDHTLEKFLVASTKRAGRYHGENKRFLDDLKTALDKSEAACRVNP